MKHLIVTTYPFGTTSDEPLQKLEKISDMGYTCSLNDLKRKYTTNELKNRLRTLQPEIIIAGTENYTADILDLVPGLKMISRVGIGLDSVDLRECQKRNIRVTNTPDAPTNAVAELTLCQLLNMVRRVPHTSRDMLESKWNRYIGNELRNITVGVVGTGRTGSSLVSKLVSLGVGEVLITDIDKKIQKDVAKKFGVKESSKNEIFSTSSIVSLHIPLDNNFGYVDSQVLCMMKPGSGIVNMSRGGIIDESALCSWLKSNLNNVAAIDTFTNEPYYGELNNLPNAYVTPHLGSCTFASRYAMEVGSANNVIDFLEDQ